MPRFTIEWGATEDSVQTSPPLAFPGLAQEGGARSGVVELASEEVQQLCDEVDVSGWNRAMEEALERLGFPGGLRTSVVCEIRGPEELLLGNNLRKARIRSIGGTQPPEVELDLSEAIEVLVEHPIGTVSDEDPMEPLLQERLGQEGLAHLEALLLGVDPVRGDQGYLEALMAVVPAESGAVLRQKDAQLEFTAARGPRAAGLLGTRFSAREGIAGICLSSQTTLVVRHARSHPLHLRTMDQRTGYRTRSLLASPIPGGGVLELLNPFGLGGFQTWHEAAAERVAQVLSRFTLRES